MRPVLLSRTRVLGGQSGRTLHGSHPLRHRAVPRAKTLPNMRRPLTVAAPPTRRKLFYKLFFLPGRPHPALSPQRVASGRQSASFCASPICRE